MPRSASDPVAMTVIVRGLKNRMDVRAGSSLLDLNSQAWPACIASGGRGEVLSDPSLRPSIASGVIHNMHSSTDHVTARVLLRKSVCLQSTLKLMQQPS